MSTLHTVFHSCGSQEDMQVPDNCSRVAQMGHLCSPVPLTRTVSWLHQQITDGWDCYTYNWTCMCCTRMMANASAYGVANVTLASAYGAANETLASAYGVINVTLASAYGVVNVTLISIACGYYLQVIK